MFSTVFAAAIACERLTALALVNVTLTAAQPMAPTGAAGSSGLPALCRVEATLKPSTDSDIKMELWLPLENWNGKFLAVGNGAFNGSIARPAMEAAVRRGYATASTDTGHTGNTAAFGLGHPERVIDFGWRAVHETAVASKAVIAAFYAAPPKYSYFSGCSAGGRQAMKSAQRFPADFAGIVAGAPGLDWTGRAAQAVRVAQAAKKDPAGQLTKQDAELVHAAVLAACDRQDGVADGVVNDPAACAFDPAVLQCGKAGGEHCLTPAKVATVKLLYSSRPNPKTGRQITALAPGSELGWTDLGWTASARATGRDQFRYLVFGDANWDIDAFDFDRDIARAEDADRDTINALDPNLKPFFESGGRLIQYHGWADPQISPGNSTQYYTRVGEVAGGAAAIGASYRLFMAPGMGHCGGGDGPNSFDMIAALERWVESGTAPDRIIASKIVTGTITRTRPLCPYPQIAKYTGSGSTDDAASFVCREP